MDREANLPVPPAPPLPIRHPISADTTSSSSSSFSSSYSPPTFLRNVQAAFKRHRGTMQSNVMRPRRMVVPQREASRGASAGSTICSKKSQDDIPLGHSLPVRDSIVQNKSSVGVVRENHDDASITPPLISGTITKIFEEGFNPFDMQREKPNSAIECEENNNPVHSSHVDGTRKKVQFSIANAAISQGAGDVMAICLETMPSHMGSLALTEMEWDGSNQVETLNNIQDESKHQENRDMEFNISLKSDAGASFLAKRTTAGQDHLHQLRNFLSQPATQSSVVGPLCATITYPETGTQAPFEPLGDHNVNSLHITQGNLEQPSCISLEDTNGMPINQMATTVQPSSSTAGPQIKQYQLPGGSVPSETEIPKNSSQAGGRPTKERRTADVTDIQSQAPLSKNSFTEVKLEASNTEKQEKVTSVKSSSMPHKRNYDPDMFFKVNGKYYQRLGKIGSGGSSEVHKVISSDCKVYALKKIKLKGRDYSTAFGFCQEIEYLNKLKGKSNIIQLIDYEVTDKSLLREVMNGCMNNKDARVKDDGHIYMVLEYGEIDLAHMLAQKWKEMESPNQTIDENWLRFYWQQILQAVNTIHEERIVHSDLKPANFLLVRGSLKLIDFGIAKAIMSDTTNIQRDSQVGTLSYMSPEAFMCNESDANGNTIKCGRPSDIWSLGCILYQMVYGRTPFSEYKTFWAKFKVITDPHHEIAYEPVSNPWLLDLMRKCLAWDRNERWRIPQLLQHPFLVPPLPCQPSPPVQEQEQGCNLLQLVAEACVTDKESSILCFELQRLLEPTTPPASQSETSRDQLCKSLLKMSKLCFKLQECLAKPLSD